LRSCFAGVKGAGKSLFARWLHHIFGKYARHIAKEGLIAGRFTGHLEGACFVFGDEAFWAGDNVARGALYGLITEPTITIEHKGRTPYDIRNPLKFIFASNHGWMVPAGPKARRWAVFDVAETYEQDKDYFKALNDEVDGGGLAAMLEYLLALDLKGWHPRNDVPQTKALQDRKYYSLSPEERWVLGILEDGVLPGPSYPNAPAVRSGRDLQTDLEEKIGKRARRLRHCTKPMSICGNICKKPVPMPKRVPPGGAILPRLGAPPFGERHSGKARRTNDPPTGSAHSSS
jgi:hypothetical protein